MPRGWGKKIVFFTGAGTSAEAGIPTFRGSATGESAVWEESDLNEVCSIDSFDVNEEKIRVFYNRLRKRASEAKPTTFHSGMREWQEKLESEGHALHVITQNIDGLFERAGVKNVMHVHGEVSYMRCRTFGHRWFVGGGEQKRGDACPDCSAIDGELAREYGVDPTKIKPDVVFFGERAPAYSAAFGLLSSLEDGDFLVISGTSRGVFPIRLFYGTRATLIFNDTVTPEERGIERLLEIQFIGPCTEQMPLIREFVDNKISIESKSCLPREQKKELPRT